MISVYPELIRKFFDGKCSPEEVHQILIWINSDEGVKQLEDEFEKFQILEKENFIKDQSVLSKIHERISQIEHEMDSHEKDNTSEKDNTRRLRHPEMDKSTIIQRWKSRIAVSFLLITMASAFWLFSTRKEEKLPGTASVSKIEYLTKQTLAGEKLTLKLNDGSIIHLNANSKVRFPKSFTGSSREVFMEGEVFFEIHRDESKPFIVHTKNLTTSVLGTSFAISEDAATQLSQVSVLTGKVKVGKYSKSGKQEATDLYLEPMEGARFDGTNKLFKKIKVEYDNAFAWKDNVIVLQNATFDEVLRKLEKWYGVSFQQNRKIKNYKDYSGKFEDQTLEEVLIGLSFTYDFKFEIQKSNIIIN